MKKPLFLVTGASGVGKTTVIPELYKVCSEYITFDLDTLHKSLGDWKVIKNVWVHVANQISHNNRNTIICGTFLPWEYDVTDLKDNFIPYFIGLYCTEELIEKRLKERKWSEVQINEHKEFNLWIQNNADKSFNPKMPLIDTGVKSPDEVALEIKNYISSVGLR